MAEFQLPGLLATRTLYLQEGHCPNCLDSLLAGGFQGTSCFTLLTVSLLFSLSAFSLSARYGVAALLGMSHWQEPGKQPQSLPVLGERQKREKRKKSIGTPHTSFHDHLPKSSGTFHLWQNPAGAHSQGDLGPSAMFQDVQGLTLNFM